MKPISNGFVGGNKVHSLRALAPLGIMTFSILGALNASALSISVPQTIGFDIVSEKAGHSEAATIEVVSSDALAGYTLTLSGSETLNASKTENGALNKITNETWTDENNFDDNTWGLKYCTKLNDTDDCTTSTVYKQPTGNLQIDKTVVNNSEPVKYALSIGAKTSNDINADTYSNTFTLAATTNPVYHSVGFVDWTENMPDAIAGTGTSITLPSNIPTKPGYTFSGWCKTKPTNNGTTCGNPATINEATGKYDLTTTDGVAYTNLYAIWSYDMDCIDFDSGVIRDLQEVEEWGHCLSVGMQISAKDTRDDNIYTVGRLPDGKIWLLDNLRLTNESADLSYKNTNVPEDWEGFGFPESNNPYKLPPSSKACFYQDPCSNNGLGDGVDTEYTGYTVPAIYRLDAQYNTNDSIEIAKTEWSYGVLYNYASASAGTVTAVKSENTQDAVYDICPKGWRMPNGGQGGEYEALNNALGTARYNGSNSEKVKKIRSALHLSFASSLWGNNVSSLGGNSQVWSSSINNGSMMYVLYVNGGSIEAFQHSDLRFGGLSVRCVAK